MGKLISRLAKRFFPQCRIKLLMVGLDASGKTTILYKMKLGEIVTTTPTIGICPTNSCFDNFFSAFTSDSLSLYIAVVSIFLCLFYIFESLTGLPHGDFTFVA